MRIQTLTEMVADLRAEIGASQNVAHGLASIEPQKALIRRVQEDLYMAYDWPHLQTHADKALDAGTQYAAYPDAFTYLDGIETVVTQGSDGRWQPLAYGIDYSHYNLKNSEADERDFPIRRWQNYMQEDGDTNYNMFEVWPLPNVAATVRFYGKRGLFPLTDGDKKSTLDGPLIVLTAAAELLARQKGPDAGLKQAKAEMRLKWLKARQNNSGTRVANLSGRPSGAGLRPGIDYMPRR